MILGNLDTCALDKLPTRSIRVGFNYEYETSLFKALLIIRIRMMVYQMPMMRIPILRLAYHTRC